MRTLLVLGPADHDRPISREEFDAAIGTEGYHYELIHGRVYVSPALDLPHDSVFQWAYGHLLIYGRSHPEVFNYLSSHPRVIVPGEEDRTNPQPDFAAYHDFPLHLDLDEVAWDDVSPILVGEVLSPDNRDKDLDRNVEIYLQVPSIREYWVFDPDADAGRWFLRVLRRRGPRWQKPIELKLGETYTTRLLPGFSLLLDPRA